MEIALHLASICVGERNYRKHRESILARNDISCKKKLHLLNALSKTHQIKTYRLLIKLCKFMRIFFKATGVASTVLAIGIMGGESEIFGVNILLGMFVLIFTFLSYKFYWLVDDHLDYYRLRLKEVKR